MQVSGVSGVPREVEEVKKKWSCLKSEAKVTAAKARQSQQQTGGGPKAEDDVSSQKQRIISIIGEVCVEGVKGGVDTAMAGM